MPSYFYHLKFELYPSPNPSEASTGRSESWLPSGLDIFDELPSHPRADRLSAHAVPTSNKSGASYSASLNHASGSGSSAAEPDVIDCGAPRVPQQNRRPVRISERQYLERSKSYPPPPSDAALRPEIAVRDWRFGQVSIESLDMAPGAAQGLGPTPAGPGTANKAELLPLRTKHTEVGWGIVHFYREGEETPSLDTVDADAIGTDEDYTTLCIPAVPTYMSPGDFLGFIGERWREDISHCRMVMTNKMNRHLALLKFRDGNRAKMWRKEFDGKIFNTMEVSSCIISCEMLLC